jgi:hypothetical protein
MGSVAPLPATVAGLGNQVASMDPLLNTDSPAYFQNCVPLVIGNSGTVAASATLGNLTLGTALDAIYGPTNNNCPGIWLYLPSTALASPNNVAGWYWAVMSSTTVGTVYAASPLNGGVSQVAGSQVNPFTPPIQNAVTFPFAPPVGASIATGSGSGYTGVTAETPGPVYMFPGGTVSPTGSLSFAAVESNNNSAGAKTIRGKVATAATLATGAVTIASVAATTAVSATLPNNQILMLGASNSWRYVVAGSAPVFGLTDFSATVYTGFSLQVAVATDWVILQLGNMTISQN